MARPANLPAMPERIEWRGWWSDPGAILDLYERLVESGDPRAAEVGEELSRALYRTMPAGGVDAWINQVRDDASFNPQGEYQRPRRQGIAPEWEGHTGLIRAYRLQQEQQRAAAAGGNIAQVAQHALHDPAERPEDFDALADAYESDFPDAAEGQRHSARIKRLRPTPVQPPAQMARQGRKRKLAKTQDTDGSFDQAMRRSLSGDQKAFRQSLDQMATQLGLPGKSASGIGDWESGAEHSTVRFTKPADMDRLRYLGAWSGLTSNQKSVLVFNPSQGGLDSVYDIQIPDKDLRSVRKKLTQAGVPFRTLIPGKKGTRVLVYDQGRALRPKVAQFAGGYGARIRESVGSGEYLGGSSRSSARAKYRDVIAAYEAKGRPQAQAR